MKWAFLLMLIAVLSSCGKPQEFTLSNQLTTFIPDEQIIPVDADTKRKIEKSTGNYQRDAIKAIQSDKRTAGYFTNLSLVNTAIYSNLYSYTFSGVTTSTINDYLTEATQQIVVTIEPYQEELFYELSFGVAP